METTNDAKTPVWLQEEQTQINHQSIEEFNLEAVAERNKALKQIEQDVTFTKEAFEVLNRQIDLQGMEIGQLESQLDNIADETGEATVSLWKAEKEANRWRWLKAGLIGMGITVVAGVTSIVAIKTTKPFNT
jgi:t-SNARE complex subunit (syntaxin)